MANKKVLSVEDDVMLLEMIKLQLESEGYDVITAENGKDGLFKAIAEVPDIILADIMMPEIDGNEMIRLIRNENSLKTVPIIVISALGRDQDKEKSYRAGANDYIVKPFTLSELSYKVRSYL